MISKKTDKNRVGWCLVPPEVIAREDLSNSEKLLLGRINGLRCKGDYCYATNKWLGKQIGLNEGTISNIISNLVKKRLIDRKIKRDKNKKVIERHLYPLSVTEWKLNNKKHASPPHREQR